MNDNRPEASDETFFIGELQEFTCHVIPPSEGVPLAARKGMPAGRFPQMQAPIGVSQYSPLSSDAVRARLRQEPFRPVQFVSTSGQNFDVYYPDHVLVARSFLLIGAPSPENPSLADQVTRLPLIELAEMRDLPAPSAGRQNGPAAK